MLRILLSKEKLWEVKVIRLRAGAAEPGRQWGHLPPPDFLKVKKVPFFLGLNAPFRTKKVFLE